MAKRVVLSGGEEFSAPSEALDRAMLQLTRKSHPDLVLVPAAAASHAHRTVRAGRYYFGRLGAMVAHTMVVDDETADMGVKTVTFENTDVIYLPDGSPLDAMNALHGTEALEKLRSRWEAGAILAACGASAMAICESYWDGGVWETGLGLLTGVAVLPHHDLIAGRFSAERLRQGIPAATVILGLDDATGVIIADRQARVVGAGFVTVYSAGHEDEYSNGQTFRLEALTIPE